MAIMYRISFPHYDEDVASERRTLLHLLECACEVGDGLTLIERPNFPRAKVATITKIDRVPLCPMSDDDLRRVNRTDRAEYLARWDVLHPEAPAASNPLIYRIEFTYGFAGYGIGDPPEWSLAS